MSICDADFLWSLCTICNILIFFGIGDLTFRWCVCARPAKSRPEHMPYVFRLQHRLFSAFSISYVTHAQTRSLQCSHQPFPSPLAIPLLPRTPFTLGITPLSLDPPLPLALPRPSFLPVIHVWSARIPGKSRFTVLLHSARMPVPIIRRLGTESSRRKRD